MTLTEANRIERVALITASLKDGDPVTAADAAEQYQVSKRTAQRDLAAISRVLPIYNDNGRWLLTEPPANGISPY